jgi:hypothetical protein
MLGELGWTRILSEAIMRNLSLGLSVPFLMVLSVLPQTAPVKLKVAAVQFLFI